MCRECAEQIGECQLLVDIGPDGQIMVRSNTPVDLVLAAEVLIFAGMVAREKLSDEEYARTRLAMRKNPKLSLVEATKKDTIH